MTGFNYMSNLKVMVNCPDCRDSCCGHFLKYLKNVADSSVVMSTQPAQVRNFCSILVDNLLRLK